MPSTDQTQKATNRKSISGSLASTSTSPRPSVVRRNTSGFVLSRPTTHNALKKNLSSGHLTKAGSSKNIAKLGHRHAAPPMKRTHSGKSQKSPTVPSEQNQHTVRFDIGVEVAPGDDSDDNEWTEDSTSISPITTRDHTRQNSVILDNNHNNNNNNNNNHNAITNSNNALRIGMDTQETTAAANASQKPIPTADAITSRLLMRNPTSKSNTTTSMTPLSNESSSIVENSSLGSAESRIVGRFVNGSTTPDIRGALLSPSKSKQRGADNDTNAASQNPSPELSTSFTDRRSRSSVALHRPLPPSRTQQKLELQRASSVIETHKHIVPLPGRPSAPAILKHSAGFESDQYAAQMQSLFAQVGREYVCVRRYRAPIAEAMARLGIGRSECQRLAAKRNKHDEENRTPQSRSGTFDGEDSASLHSTYGTQAPPTSQQSSTSAHRNHTYTNPLESPNSQKRRNRVSFELPTHHGTNGKGVRADDNDDGDDGDDDNDDDEQGLHMGSQTRRRAKPVNEVRDLCKRLWEMDMDTFGDGMME